MGATISLVQASRPDGVTAAAAAIQQAVTKVQKHIQTQQGLMRSLGQNWAGPASTVAMGRGDRIMQSQIDFRDRLEAVRRALRSGGQQLSALSAQILSLSTQASALGGIVGDDGTVRPSGSGRLMTPAVAKAYSAVLQKMLRTFDSVDAATAAAVQQGGRSGSASLVIARQNPSVDVDGNVKVANPDVKVQQAPDGAVRIQYGAKNAFAPPGADLSGHVVRGDIVVTPGAGGQPASIDGVVGDYPSLEVYQEMPNGTSHTVAQDAADSGNPYGPLTELPFSHEIGSGSSAFEPLASYAPQLQGGPRYPDDTIPYVPGQIDANTPTDLGPTDKIPDVVVVF